MDFILFIKKSKTDKLKSMLMCDKQKIENKISELKNEL